MSKINKKAILKRLKEKNSDRKKVTLYLSEHLYEQFKKSCDGVPASQVIEELMKEFIN